MSTIMKFTIAVAAVAIGMLLFTSDQASAAAADRKVVIGDREVVQPLVVDRSDQRFVPIGRRVILRPFFNRFVNIEDPFFFEEDPFFFGFDARPFVRERAD